MKSRLFISGFTLCLLVTFLSCSEPRCSETFIPIEKVDSLGRYCFNLEMTDTAAFYDLSFYSRIDCTASMFQRISEFPLDVTFVSPSEIMYSERVYIPLPAFGKNNFPDFHFYERYRSGLVPVEYGMWKMYVSAPDIKGLRGLGLVVEKKQ